MNFTELLLGAKAGEEERIRELLKKYRNLLLKWSMVDGRFDEDLYQELCITLVHCVNKFRI